MTITFLSRLIRQRLADGYDIHKGSKILAARINEQKQAAA